MPDINIKEVTLKSKLLLVGAGGIGCEVLKNLVLTGFEDIVVIDLDTIDVSNLNRQFLFQKKHVGKSKALVAKESAERYNPAIKIEAIHNSILNSEYDIQFYKTFSLVINALDNKVARSHVNRMCLAANIPLLESGTAGYLGQTTLILKNHTECYECQPKPSQKSYPSCTIRNTPSEPIHCVVWAKHLFNQIFGEPEIDEEVSPDSQDEEIDQNMKEEVNSTPPLRISIKEMAMNDGYNAQKLFEKLFKDDINYLLRMSHLWTDRTKPKPLDWNLLPDAVASSSIQETAAIKDQQIWSIKQCANIFDKSFMNIKTKMIPLPEGEHLTWDKDEEDFMDFVAACANIRAYCFGIQQKSRFDIKSMAGNIIPAIASTNAIVAGLIVLNALKIVRGEISKCCTLYLNKQPNPKKKIIVPCVIDKPNPKCYVCSPKSEISLAVNVDKMTVKMLDEKVLKKELSMVAPDIEVVDGKGTILISSEEGDTEENMDKPLAHFNLKTGAVLKCDDFLQNFTLHINLIHKDKLSDDQEYEIEGNAEDMKPQPDIKDEDNQEKDEKESTKQDLKRPADDSNDNHVQVKKRKLESENSKDDSIMVLDDDGVINVD